MTKKEKVALLLQKLREIYPHPKTALNYSTPFELLIATILSAQTTDKLVNTVTPTLFERYPTPEKMAQASIDDITGPISKINFANNKAKNIKAASEMIVKQYNGSVPDTMEELDALPGVARKTANVVLGNAFHKAEGIVVDTHVMRLATKLGLTDKKDPEKIERDLMEIVPKDSWIDFSHLLILFGREYCPARPHECASCPLSDINICPDELGKDKK